jgi:hypothetical protein
MYVVATPSMKDLHKNSQATKWRSELPSSVGSPTQKPISIKMRGNCPKFQENILLVLLHINVMGDFTRIKYKNFYSQPVWGIKMHIGGDASFITGAHLLQTRVVE